MGTEIPFVRRFSAGGVFEGVRIEEIDLGGAQVLTYNGGGEASVSGEVVVSFKNEKRVLKLQSPSGAIRIEGLARRWMERNY